MYVAFNLHTTYAFLPLDIRDINDSTLRIMNTYKIMNESLNQNDEVNLRIKRKVKKKQQSDESS